ncbi:MAG TPA: hypothetical protein VNQ76_13285 [Planctomicrobium sp.]|nr:hypothetical protein [Planctomicrobium sp.]
MSSLTDQEIIRLLNSTGHLAMPFGKQQGVWPVDEEEKLSLQVAEVREAVRSYQSMYSSTMEHLVAKHHPDRSSVQVIPDGDIGPATLELLGTSRCACPDYAQSIAEPALGSGNWKSCHGIGDFHCAKVKLVNSFPSFLAPVWDEVWARVVAAYDEVGLRFELTNGNDYNTTIEFVNPNGGWIGLAIVGTGSLSCTSKIWSKYDRNFRPSNVLSEWTSLIKHELGHNCGLDHSSGGVMNPYIISGLPVSWKGDPSWSLLARRFGGQPVKSKNPTPLIRDLVVAWKYSDGTYEDLLKVPNNDTKLIPV